MILNFGFQYANYLKDVFLDLYRFAEGRVTAEGLLRRIRAEDDDLPMGGEVCRLEVSALIDIQLPVPP
jgi:hypothetical protein